MQGEIHEYIIQTFNMFYADRLIWYGFGALDLTFNPWGTSTKLKPHVSSCLPPSTEKYERKSVILTIQKITYQQRNTQKKNGMTYALLAKTYNLRRKTRHSFKQPTFLFTLIDIWVTLIQKLKKYSVNLTFQPQVTS